MKVKLKICDSVLDSWIIKDKIEVSEHIEGTRIFSFDWHIEGTKYFSSLSNKGYERTDFCNDPFRTNYFCLRLGKYYISYRSKGNVFSMLSPYII